VQKRLQIDLRLEAFKTMIIEDASIPSVMTITSATRQGWLGSKGRRKRRGIVALQGEKPREPSGWANSAPADRGVLPVFRLGPVAKRMIDIAAATLGLLLFSPILLIASIAIKLDSRGPVLIRETRYGYKNRPIQLLRFRLVTACAENDRTSPRLTRVGRILNQTGIDELPQLFNVLRGQMSIAGPRPCCHPRASLNGVRPGMIGWAQIVATREQRPDADPH
jgi:hypothetical protein